MHKTSQGITPQPLIAIVTVVVALLAIAISYGLAGASSSHLGGGFAALIIPCLVVGVVLAYQFPIYVRHNTKLYVFTVPLFLMAASLPAPLAASAAGLAILTGELAVRAQRGNTYSSTLTHAGRWSLVALLGSVVAHIPVSTSQIGVEALPLLAAGLVMLIGDIVTFPLALCPISGERPSRVIVLAAREAGLTESAQYMVGILGALVVMQQAWTLILLALPTILVYLVFKKEIDQDTYQLLESMADAVDLRDPYTGGHSRRVANLSKGILEELGMHGQEAALIAVSARLHDIGKIGIPDHVLIKPSGLSPEEQALMQTYPDRGAELLARYPDFARGVEMVRHHHERWDGSGYPSGLSGTDIPFGARLIAVADSFDAMTNDRPYRRALPMERAAAILLEGSGRQWDPAIVEAFLRSIAGSLKQPVEPLKIRMVSELGEESAAVGEV